MTCFENSKILNLKKLFKKWTIFSFFSLKFGLFLNKRIEYFSRWASYRSPNPNPKISRFYFFSFYSQNFYLSFYLWIFKAFKKFARSKVTQNGSASKSTNFNDHLISFWCKLAMTLKLVIFWDSKKTFFESEYTFLTQKSIFI